MLRIRKTTAKQAATSGLLERQVSGIGLLMLRAYHNRKIEVELLCGVSVSPHDHPKQLAHIEMTIHPDDKISRKIAFASRVKDDLVFFDETAGQYFATGSVGADIWELIEEPRSLRDICAELMERYEVDETTCLTDVQRFAEELLGAGLVERK